VLFAIVRKVEVNEGFFVTGILFPLILPPTTPLWQAALGISFGVVLAKEVFGGTGMNFVNPALAARAFLFFAYPAFMSGDQVWTAALPSHAVDGFLRCNATRPDAPDDGAFRGPAVLVDEGLHRPRTRLHGRDLRARLPHRRRDPNGHGHRLVAHDGRRDAGHDRDGDVFNLIGSMTNPYFAVPFWWHMVAGGWAFGTVFMATDPVTSPFSERGKWIYGTLIGVFVVLVRTVNPAYPESMMLVILFMNVIAPLIDYALVRANVRRRQKRRAET
jgi:Na+-transporting NADH:ubiquinone oxidoreductase subunit B